MEILDQLKSKITQTIESLENLQLTNMELQEELEQTRQQLTDSQQRNDELAANNETLQKENTRISHEKHEIEARVQSLLQTLDMAVSDLSATDTEQRDTVQETSDGSADESNPPVADSDQEYTA